MKPPTTPREMIAHLQRENAALRRDVYQCSPTSENDYEGLKWCDAYEELERENAALRAAIDESEEFAKKNAETCGSKIRELLRENAALRELTSTLGAPNHINVPVEQWREMRADKERLDWIAKNRSVSVTERPLAVTPDSLRASIDAARKEAQP